LYFPLGPLFQSPFNLLHCFTKGAILLQTAPPLFNNNPFIAVWNAPTEFCQKNQIDLDMEIYTAVTSPAKVPGQPLTLFYANRLGEYPYINELTKEKYYGGFPQEGHLKGHLAKASEDIQFYIPSAVTPGLAVIDWEEWRPIWSRNWGEKKVYILHSITVMKKQKISWSMEELFLTAERAFETAARKYMAETLILGQEQRPYQLWGFYLFPDCYNYDYKNANKPYTGKCSSTVMSQNDLLHWLWGNSSALYPSVYLSIVLKNSEKTALFVRNRVQEAKRVARLHGGLQIPPIYVYNRPVFTDLNSEFLSETDLIHTIGECAALGVAGVILWGASADYSIKRSCEELSKQLTQILNPYIANVSAAAKLCSNLLCQGKGRCTRKNYDASDYLHLNAANFKIQKKRNGKYFAVGTASPKDLSDMANKFTCTCYVGENCQAHLPAHIPNTQRVIPI
uniref:Hyaluronidase n=1 Tax=Erpetoichthys calabaricus TaxID=27687 RepID=A0A8C4RLQ0_ERPCA